jgi:hypothetical protein
LRRVRVELVAEVQKRKAAAAAGAAVALAVLAVETGLARLPWPILADSIDTEVVSA